jgi:hypothetical protein
LYFSIGGVVPKNHLSTFWLFQRILEPLEGPNDGCVSLHSAQWGYFLGVIEVDHLQQINWTWKRNMTFFYNDIATLLSKIENDFGVKPQEIKLSGISEV